MEVLLPHDIAAARAGDEHAAGRLIAEFHAPIHAFLRRLAGSDADAEDLTQRTFARVWSSLGTYAGSSSISSWIHGIAHHVYVDWRRADRRGEFQPDEWWENRVASGPNPAELAASADLARTAYSAVDRLEPGLRSTIHLHYYQGLTLQETADALGVAVSTVKYRVRSALDQLQIHFERHPLSQSKLPTPRP